MVGKEIDKFLVPRRAFFGSLMVLDGVWSVL